VQGNLVFESIADAARSPAPRNSGRVKSGLVNLQFVL
jgi:hypothetical protein